MAVKRTPLKGRVNHDEMNGAWKKANGESGKPPPG